MKICPILILILVLHEGTAESLSAREGEDISFRCWFYFPGHKAFFCKNNCESEDILVQTSGDSQQNGRYSVQFDGSKNVNVSIKSVTRADSGKYQCVLERPVFNGHHEFWIDVEESEQLQTTTAPSTTKEPEQLQTTTAPSSTNEYMYLLFLALIAVIVVILFVLIFNEKRKSQNDKETTGRSRGANATVAASEDRIYQSLSVNMGDPGQEYCTINRRAQSTAPWWLPAV